MATGVEVSFPDAGVLVATWAALTDGEAGDWVDAGRFSDFAIQVSGTLGGATVNIQGSVDKVVAANLNNPQGSAIALTAAGVAQILENMRYVRPNVVGGTSSDIKVLLRGKSIS